MLNSPAGAGAGGPNSAFAPNPQVAFLRIATDETGELGGVDDAYVRSDSIVKRTRVDAPSLGTVRVLDRDGKLLYEEAAALPDDAPAANRVIQVRVPLSPVAERIELVASGEILTALAVADMEARTEPPRVLERLAEGKIAD